MAYANLTSFNFCVVCTTEQLIFPRQAKEGQTKTKETEEMKLKAVLFDNTPQALIVALEKIRPDVMNEVLVTHLKVLLISARRILRPAFRYGIQRRGRRRTRLDVRSPVDRCFGPQNNFKRAVADFWNAGIALTELYKRKIRECVPKGHRVQLSWSSCLMRPYQTKPEDFPLVESTPEWVAVGASLAQKKRN